MRGHCSGCNEVVTVRDHGLVLHDGDEYCKTVFSCGCDCGVNYCHSVLLSLYPSPGDARLRYDLNYANSNDKWSIKI